MSKIKRLYGYPFAQSVSEFFELLRLLALPKWEPLGDPILLKEFEQLKLDPQTLEFIKLYAGRTFVQRQRHPTSTIFNRFYRDSRAWAMGFPVIPHKHFGQIVVLVVDHKQGRDKYMIHCPAGSPSETELRMTSANPFAQAVLRETQEETGIVGKKAWSLNGSPWGVSGGQSTEICQHFLIEPVFPSVWTKASPDKLEVIRTILVKVEAVYSVIERIVWPYDLQQTFELEMAISSIGLAERLFNRLKEINPKFRLMANEFPSPYPTQD